MNNQTEQEFFEAFEINKKFIDCANSWCSTNNDGTKRKKPICYNPKLGDYGNKKCLTCNANIMRYPKITPTVVLRLISICCRFHHDNECCYLICGDSEEKIIEGILKDCIEFKTEIQEQVKELFQ